MTVGVVSPGHMGSGLGWALRQGGERVVTTVAGRSPRSAALAAAAGLEVLPDLASVLAVADVVLVVTPPGEALNAAEAIAGAVMAKPHAGPPPLVADLNAIAPSTVALVASILQSAGVDLVDGSISGAPPTVRAGARLYFSGPRAPEVSGLRWQHVRPAVLGRQLGSASALKMCTASVYKGTVALYTQAIRVAAKHGVVDAVLADIGEDSLPFQVASAASKAHRYVAEMREISATQGDAGLPASLFAAFAQVYAQVAATELATADAETVPRDISVDDVLRRLG